MLFLGILNKKIHMAFIAHKIEGKAGVFKDLLDFIYV